jgi:uncharacterized protein (DUF1330 family)
VSSDRQVGDVRVPDQPHAHPERRAQARRPGYLERVEATFAPYGGKWLVLDAQVEVLEGAWPGSVVLMEFPDMDAAKQWYHSPEYQEILHLRTDNVISDLILVDPVGPDFTSADYAGQIRTLLAAGSDAGT